MIRRHQQPIPIWKLRPSLTHSYGTVIVQPPEGIEDGIVTQVCPGCHQDVQLQKEYPGGWKFLTVGREGKGGRAAMTQDSIVEQKEIRTLAQGGNSQLPKWCLLGIAAARVRGEKGLFVVLTTADSCEALNHGTNATCALMRVLKQRKRLEADCKIERLCTGSFEVKEK